MTKTLPNTTFPVVLTDDTERRPAWEAMAYTFDAAGLDPFSGRDLLAMEREIEDVAKDGNVSLTWKGTRIYAIRGSGLVYLGVFARE